MPAPDNSLAPPPAAPSAPARGHRGAPPPPGASGYSVWRSIGLFVGDRKAAVLALALASLAGAVTEAGILTIAAQAATRLVNSHARSVHVAGLTIHATVGTLLWVGVALTVVRLVLQVPIALIPSTIAGNVQANMRRRLFTAFSVASWDLQSQDREGHFQEMMTNQITMGSQGALQATGMVIALFTFLTLAVSAFALNVIAAVVVLAAALAMFAALRPLNILATRFARSLSASQLEYAGAVGEANSIAEETRVFGVAQRQRERIDAYIRNARHFFVRTQVITRFSNGLYQNFIYTILIVGLIVVHGAGLHDVSALGAVVLLLVRASTYGQQVQNLYQLMRQSLPFIERIDAAVDSYERSVVVSGDAPLGPLRTLAFEDISYTYTTAASVRPALRELSFEVAGGETIGVVGPSGAGKSTMVQVMLGLRAPQSGRYTLNDVDALEYSREAWARRVVYVPQQPRLVYGTVADNVRFFRDIDDAAVERACRLARIHDEITSWDGGYATIVGPRAAAVSGGQQQRLCLARSLAAEPEFLILDEPTSALDPRSEALIQESLLAIRERLTLFIIAHRMSTLSICDRVMVILDGSLDAFDTVDGLRRHNAYYRMASSLALGESSDLLDA